MSQETNETTATTAIVRLAKPRKKGLFSLIFSRFFLIAVLIIIQIDVLIIPLALLEEYLHYVYGGLAVFTLIMMFYLFNSKMDSTAKVTWMFIIAVLQVGGALLLLFTQANTGHRKTSERTAEIVNSTKDTIPQDPEVLEDLRVVDSYTDDLVTYLNRSGCFPVYKGTEVTYFPIGEDKFQAMLTELAKAEKYIFMEYFIIEEGYMWGSILNILIEKAKAGVDVRVMYDGMCEISNLPSNYCSLLEKQGIKARSFAPLQPFLSSHYNYRDHRKICVIDGKTAFNGGVNLADEYINEKRKFGYWKDAGIRMTGAGVWSFTSMFLEMWDYITKTEDDYEFYRKASTLPEDAVTGPGYIQPYSDSPLDHEDVGENVYLNLIEHAKKYVYIFTPYLILGSEMTTALVNAAKCGVDVRIVVPGIPDKKMVYLLTQANFEHLLKHGVKIYKYTPGFIHSKCFVVDDVYAAVGTINLDYRSLYLHFECGTFMYKTKAVMQVKADALETFTKCHEMTKEECHNKVFIHRVFLGALKLFAPLL